MTQDCSPGFDAFRNPKFCNEILGIADAHGGPKFWIENLRPDMNPDATWRALMVIGCMENTNNADDARRLLNHSDSRVRAWACFALGRLHDESSVEKIYALCSDPSNRVRVHARQTLQKLVGFEKANWHIFARNHTQEQECRILISEDSLFSLRFLPGILRNEKHHVDTAETASLTLKKALASRPKIIITDNQKGLDNLSGLNMTWDICRTPELRETIIIMRTADFVEPMFLWSGGDYFLLKDIGDPEQILLPVHEYLSTPRDVNSPGPAKIHSVRGETKKKMIVTRYGGNRTSYEVVELESGRIEVRVLHKNQGVRRLIRNNATTPRFFNESKAVSVGNQIRALHWLGKVVSDYGEYFREGRVDFILK